MTRMHARAFVARSIEGARRRAARTRPAASTTAATPSHWPGATLESAINTPPIGDAIPVKARASAQLKGSPTIGVRSRNSAHVARGAKQVLAMTKAARPGWYGSRASG